MALALGAQIALLLFHQITTLFDFFPFNGARNYTRKERLAEAGANGILMLLPVIGFAWRIRGLMAFGVIYYFVLFLAEVIIWWIPYFSVPAGRWRAVYNRLLGMATSNFESGDTLDHWRAIHHRLHRGTISFLPPRDDRIVPNLEHAILHAWTLATALITALAYAQR